MAKIVYGSLLSTGREKLIERCANMMDRAGVRYAYIVPTRQLQREVQLGLMERLRQGRTVLAFLEPRVYLFDGFVGEILKAALAYQTPLRADQQKWILRDVAYHLKEAGRLPFLQDLVGYEGFYLSLHQWLTEVKGTGVTPEGWLASAISDKERELGLIYAAYEEFLSNHALVDQERNYAEVIRQLQMGGPDLQAGAFAGLELVVIDGFYKLTQLQLRLVKALMEWGTEVIVHTFLEEERRELFLSAREMVEMLERSISTAWLVERETSMENGRSQGLHRLCTQLFQLSAEPQACDPSVGILYTPDPYQEIEVLGRKIKQMLLEDGDLRLGELALILRNVESSHFYIDEVFRELGIPYEISMGMPLSETPIFRLVMKLYRIFAEDWSRESVVEVLKSSYLSLAKAGEAERWEEWILEAGIIGGEADWTRKLDRLQLRLTREEERARTKSVDQDELGETSEALAERVRLHRDEIGALQEVLREFFLQLKKLEKTQTLFEHSKALMEFFAIYGLDRRVVETREYPLLRRDLLSLHQLQQLLGEMVRFGELFEGIDAHSRTLQSLEFLQDLTAGAELSMVPEPEAKLDAVQILTPSQSRGCRFKRVFIGGLVEGEFPWYGQRDWLFKPEERKALKERGIHFKQVYERLEEERLFFLEATCSATERLVLSCPVLPGDERARSSSFLHEVQNLFLEGTLSTEVVVLERVQRDYDRLQRAMTRRELDENMLREMWESRMSGEIPCSTEQIAHLSDLLVRGEMVQSREGANYSEYDGLLAQPEIRDGLNRTYHADRVYSISQINEYAICPFQFYCKRILHLARVEEPVLRLEPLDLGNIYHQILFEFFHDFHGWEEETMDAALVRLQGIAEGVLTDHPASFSLPVGLWTAYCGEILEHLERIISFEYAEAARQGYVMRPQHLEASFGLQKGLQERDTLNHPEPVVITRTVANDENGEIQVRFSGKIDRIDLSADGRYLIIYDYKLGRRDGLDDMEEGLDLQLPIYVKAAKMLCGDDLEVLGAGYFSILKCDRRSGIWRDVQPELVPVSGRSKNCLSGEAWERLLAQADEFVIDYIRRIRSGDFRVDPAQCPKYCNFSKICRFEHARHRRKAASVAAVKQEVNTDEV